ncbi:MAG: class I SAM-dependent methyltransferase [Caldilineaceae bacterium]
MKATGMQNISQLLMRNLASLRGERLLVVNYPPDDFLLLLRQQLPGANVMAFNQHYAAHEQLCTAYQRAKLDATQLIFAPVYIADDSRHDLALIFLPKSRPLIEVTLAMVGAALQPGAACFLVGENDSGIRSSRSLLEERIGPARTVDAARHCVLFQATKQVASVPFHLADWRTSYSLSIGQQNLTVVSLPGVFSHGRLDEGTQLLLETLELPAAARVLDFGCGAGVIGATIKQRWPTCNVTLVDANALALEATHQTMLANDLPVDTIKPSDVFSNVQETYTHILSNPPFHTGVKTDYRMVTTFLQEASRHLVKGGKLRIVANSFLKYQPFIEANVGPCRVVAENRYYRVYEGTHE